MKVENICDVCLGEGTPISGKPCICGGTGTLVGKLDGMRAVILDLENQLDARQDEINKLKREISPHEYYGLVCSNPDRNVEAPELEYVFESYDPPYRKECHNEKKSRRTN